VVEFRRFDLGWWIDGLQDVLEEFVAAAQGKVHRGFWESIYKWQGPRGSGSPYVSGWILKLFPYLDSPEAKWFALTGEETSAPLLRRNPWLSHSTSEKGPGRDDFPSMPAKAPFRWKFSSTEYEMELVGGFLGISQDPDSLSLRPEIGWAVREAQKGRAKTGWKSLFGNREFKEASRKPSRSRPSLLRRMFELLIEASPPPAYIFPEPDLTGQIDFVRSRAPCFQYKPHVLPRLRKQPPNSRNSPK
jgi:hypothetical protein